MPRMIPRRRLRLAALAAVSAAAILASGLDLRVRDTHLAFEGGQVTIGAARLPSLLGIAFAQSADTVVLENVTVAFGTETYRIPRAEFAGVNLSRAEVAALFDTANSETVGNRLARLSARSITIPELIAEQVIGDQRSSVSYKNVSARDIVQGRMASLTSSGAAVRMTTADKGEMVGTYGRMTIDGLDLGEMSRLYTEKAPTADAPMRKIYDGFSIEAIALSSPKDGTEIRVAAGRGQGFSARPTKQGWGEAIKSFVAAAEASEKGSDADKVKFFGLMGDVLGAFEVGQMEMTGFEIREPKNDEKKTPGVVGRIDKIAYAGAGGQPSEMRIEGLDVTAEDARVRLGLISFKGFSFKSTFDALKAMDEKSLTSLDPAELRKLIPTIGTVRLSGIDVETNDGAKGQKPEPVKFGIKDVELTADKPINGVPTNLRIGVDGLSFPIPAGSTEDGLKDLLAMGYKTLDISWLTAANWNEPTSELQIREISFTGKDMGTATLRGTLGSVTKDVFDADSAIAMVALIGSTAKNLELKIENKGLFERALAQEAKKQKKSAEELRREYGAAAAVGIPALLGNSPSARSIGQAAGRFVAKPGRLTLTAKTKDPAGLGIADVASLGEPAAVLEKLDVTAVAD